jgi:GAF domain-containing protein
MNGTVAMTGSADVDLAKAFVQVAHDISHHEDLEQTRQHIVELAQTSLGSLGTAIWHLTPAQQMTLDAATDAPFLIHIQDILAAHPDGPSWQALHTSAITVAADFTSERRWPGYVADVLARTPVRSAVSYPLASEEPRLGVLSVYAERPGHFTSELVEMGAIYAAHAALALEKAFAEDRAANLARALASNRRIGMAIGILMSGDKLTEEQAFDLMRVSSQRLHRKLFEVAEDVILTGTADTDLVRR